MNQTLSDLGFLRVGVASPALRVADVPYNLEQLADAIRVAGQRHCQLLIFPELAITGYSIRRWDQPEIARRTRR